MQFKATSVVGGGMSTIVLETRGHCVVGFNDHSGGLNNNRLFSFTFIFNVAADAASASEEVLTPCSDCGQIVVFFFCGFPFCSNFRKL